MKCNCSRIEELSSVTRANVNECLHFFWPHIRNTRLHVAALRGCLSCINWLTDQGADVNAFDERGETPLHDALRTRQYEVVLHLLRCGAQVDNLNEFGQTPLGMAIQHSSVNDTRAIVALLLTYGAKVSEMIKRSQTLLELLECERGCRNVCVTLLGIRRFRRNQLLDQNVKDIFNIIVGMMWKTRYTNVWVKHNLSE